jgi:hypothetical protein
VTELVDATAREKGSGRTLLKLLLVALVLNTAVGFFYPSPHDFNNYLEGADRVLSGEQLYGSVTRTGEVWFYGPLWAGVLAVIVKYLGVHYFYLKLPAILAGTLMVLPVYKMLEHFRRDALHGTLFFIFSYLLLFNTLIGNDDVVMVLFVVLCIYSLLKEKIFAAGVFYTIALGFKIIPVVLLPAIIIYLVNLYWDEEDPRGRISLSMTCIFLLPPCVIGFIALTQSQMLFGQDITYPYLHPFSNHPVTLLGPLNFLRMSMAFAANILHYFILGVGYALEDNPLKPVSTHPINLFVNLLRTPLLVFGYGLTLVYLFFVRMKDYDKELIRNILLLLFTGFIFGRYFDPLYLLWAFPFLLLFMNVKFNFTTTLYIAPLIVFGMFYRWTPNIPLYQHLLLHLTPFAVLLITFHSVKKWRTSWSLMMFVFAMFRITEIIPRPYLYALYYYLVVALSVPALLLCMGCILKVSDNVTEGT